MVCYLQGLTRKYISMVIHQCAQFCNNPRLVDKRVARIITKYLANISIFTDLQDRKRQLYIPGMVSRPNKENH